MSEKNESVHKDSFQFTFTDSRLPGGENGNDYQFMPDLFPPDFEDDNVFGTNLGYLKSSDSPDKINCNSSSFSENTNHISFASIPTFNMKFSEDTNKNGFWKYEEDKTLKDIEQYLSSTYHSHYTSESSKTQTLDLIESIGDAEAFCRSNAIKYLSRFGKKNGKSKQDILKAIHYCILLYHFAGLHKNKTDQYQY